MKLQLNDWLPSDPDFELFHIYCHQKDYRLCSVLNEHFKYEFFRTKDFLEDPDDPTLATYAQFVYVDEVLHKEYFLIANQPLVKTEVAKAGDLFAAEQPDLLIPELPKVDYFLQLYGQFEEHELSEIEDRLNVIPLINAAQRVDTSALRSYVNLMH